jgi:hypothetical protein
MKMVIICYNEAINEEIQEILNSENIEGYTEIPKTIGKGIAGGPHFMSHIWPKANNVLFSCVEDNKANSILNKVKQLRAEMANIGLKAFSLPVDSIT